MLLSVPQRLYQSPGPHTPWGCVAAINAASQTERFVVSSISTYIGVGSNNAYASTKHSLEHNALSIDIYSGSQSIMKSSSVMYIVNMQ